MTAWLLAILGFPVGAVVGSFATTWAIRAGRAEQALAGRSRCDGCGLPLGFSRTVPLWSYVSARGACAACGIRIDPLHPVGEFAGGLVAVAAVLSPDPVRGALIAALGLVLIAASCVDLTRGRLPNGLTAAAAALCLGLAAQRSPHALLGGLAAAALVLAALLALRWIFKARRGDPGLGLGDVKLAAALAVWLGPATPWMMAAAALLGLVALLIFRPGDGRLPFGPFIAVAGFSVAMFQEFTL